MDAASEFFKDKHPEAAEIFGDPTLNDEEKRSKLLPYMPELRKHRYELGDKISSAKNELNRLNAIDEIIVWTEKLEGMDEINIERNDCSRLHDLSDAIDNGGVYYVNKEDENVSTDSSFMWSICHAFVVEHDWAQAFRSAEGYEGDAMLPYPVTAFEFRIAGKSIINLAVQDDGAENGDKFGLVPFVKSSYGWICLGQETTQNKVFRHIYDQIKAICIALESEIAEENIIRAPAKLNKKRIAKSKRPLPDYHVVSLNKKHGSRFNGGGEGLKKRFHFRRGHWRHFETHKTYIKWMLVGNPELGFIDKHYKL